MAYSERAMTGPPWHGPRPVAHDDLLDHWNQPFDAFEFVKLAKYLQHHCPRASWGGPMVSAMTLKESVPLAKSGPAPPSLQGAEIFHVFSSANAGAPLLFRWQQSFSTSAARSCPTATRVSVRSVRRRPFGPRKRRGRHRPPKVAVCVQAARLRLHLADHFPVLQRAESRALQAKYAPLHCN